MSLNSSDFIQGFVIGQVLLLTTLLILLRFFLFRSNSHTKAPSTEPKVQIVDGSIDKHDWLNFMISSYVNRYRNPKSKQMIQAALSETINSAESKYISPIIVKDLRIGAGNPTLVSGHRFMDKVRLKIDYRHGLLILVETEVQLSITRVLASLPVSLEVEIECMTLECVFDLNLWILSVENVELAVNVGSVIGHRTKLKDLPAVSEIIKERILKAIKTELNSKKIKIPTF